MSKKFNSKLRSQQWFDNPENPGMTALYIERSLNFGLTPEELRSGKPIIGIAQTGSDISPCNRIHVKLAERVREGIRSAGGIALEFPVHPIQETLKIAIKKLKISQYVDYSLSNENVKNPKPHPEIYKVTLDKLNLHKEFHTQIKKMYSQERHKWKDLCEKWEYAFNKVKNKQYVKKISF